MLGRSRHRVRRASVALAILMACTGDSALTVAPNLLSPAPAPSSGAECVFGMIRADIVRGRDALEAMGPYAPTWLPPGFGLAVAWRPPDDPDVMGSEAGAIWTDEACRQVRFEIFLGAADEESPRPDREWRLSEPGECTFGDLRDVPCVSYHAQANGDVVNLMTADLPEEITRRIVDGIDVTT